MKQRGGSTIKPWGEQSTGRVQIFFESGVGGGGSLVSKDYSGTQQFSGTISKDKQEAF